MSLMMMMMMMSITIIVVVVVNIRSGLKCMFAYCTLSNVSVCPPHLVPNNVQ